MRPQTGISTVCPVVQFSLPRTQGAEAAGEDSPESAGLTRGENVIENLEQKWDCFCFEGSSVGRCGKPGAPGPPRVWGREVCVVLWYAFHAFRI